MFGSPILASRDLTAPGQLDSQQRQRGWSHAGNSLGLAEGFGPHRGELALQLRRQARDAAETEVLREAGVLVAALARDVVALPVHIAGIFNADLDLFGDFRVIGAGAQAGS